MKTGILTFHRAPNYGAVLQTFASVSLLRNWGYDCVVLDYENPAVAKASSPFRFDRGRLKEEGLSYLLKYFPTCVVKYRRHIKFRRFINKYLPIAPIETEVDVYLIGSDQVWNSAITSGEDPYYSGESLSGAVAIAWSASAGSEGLSEGQTARILKNFKAISIREESLLASFPGAEVIPDPTLMAPPQSWEPLLKEVAGEKYILAYPMIKEEEVLSKARERSNETGLPLVVISNRATLQRGRINCASPEEFLSLIKNASEVVTSSFHGAAFAKVFSRPLTLVSDESDPRFAALDRSIAEGTARARHFLEKSL